MTSLAMADEKRSPSKPIITSATVEQLVAHYNSQLPDYNAALAAHVATLSTASAAAADKELLSIDDPATVLKEDVIELIRRQNHRLKRFIRPRAMQLLQTIVSTNADGRTVGYTYDQVLDLIAIEFPESSTSAACLRWYVVHAWSEADEEGLPRPKMPQSRPRSTSKRNRSQANVG